MSLRNFNREWKDGKWEYSLDERNYDDRPRVRTGRMRHKCKDCVKQGLNRLAQNFAWCNGLCKMHARQKGLKDPKKIN